MIDRLELMVRRHDELTALMSQPEVATDPDLVSQYAREAAGLEDVVRTYREYQSVSRSLAETEAMLTGGLDADMAELARDEVAELRQRQESLVATLKGELAPRDPNDEKDVVVEIRAGTGGDEAALFASDLYRMYSRYAERHRWGVDVVDLHEIGIGGFKEIVFEIHGRGAYSDLKFESGVHRVQRVPTTEAQGRIHTSTATVAVLPEVEEVEIDIREEDLRIDVYRSSGAGGQNVQKNSTAIRITHIPTGMVVTCQDERSQLKNRMKAMNVLRARLFAIEQRKRDEQIETSRRSQVGSGERSEKIRTYNFPQDRLTDHRIGLTVHGLERILDGDLGAVVEALQTHDREEREAGAPALTAREALARGIGRLRLAGVEDAPFEARILLEQVLGLTRAGLLARPLLDLDSTAQATYDALVDRRANREPLPYILGHWPFRHLDLLVDRRALIPRPETELLAELALALALSQRESGQDEPNPLSPFPVGKGGRVAADVGTGSGALAVTLALEAPCRRVYATDLSPDALALAEENARRHGVADRVTFLLGDLLDPLPEPVDLIVANLPYVPTVEASSQPELGWEPRLALDGGPDGLDVYRCLLERALRALRPRGSLLFEIGAGEGDAALALARRAFPDSDVSLHRDYEGRDRVVEVRGHSSAAFQMGAGAR